MSVTAETFSEKTISVYRDVLTGNAKRKQMLFKDPPNSPGSSRRAPLWTHWARPVRREAHTSKHDDLYICREDGIVRFLEISEENDLTVDATGQAGKLGCNIDTAFASLDLGLDRDDLLFAGGEMSDGGLHIFQARQAPVHVQCIPNWTPSIDFVTATVIPADRLISGRSSSGFQEVRSRDRIFAGAGRGEKYGAVAELRFGLEARMGTRVGLEDGGALRLWCLPDLSGDGLYFLLSYPLYSLLFNIRKDMPILVVGDDDESTGLDLKSTTLAAGVTPEGLIIQVTDSSVRVTNFAKAEPRFVWDSAEKIVAAAVAGRTSQVITAIRTGDNIVLHLGRVTNHDEVNVTVSEIGGGIVLQSEPTCIFLDTVNGADYLLLGTTRATLQIFRMTLALGLTLLTETTLESDSGPAMFSVCESLAIAISGEYAMVVCGLRNGCLQVFHMEFGPNLGESVVEKTRLSLQAYTRIQSSPYAASI